MKEYHYVGLDVHKKVIAYCIKRADGTIVDEGTVAANRASLGRWVQNLERPWIGAMEATLFTGWIYDFLLPYAEVLKVAHPFMLKAIVAAKHKNDRISARKLADGLRANMLPECYMAPAKIRELRRVLRYRNLRVTEAVRMKNKAAGLLMEVGAEYNKRKLHGKRYFRNLLETVEDVPDSVRDLLRLTHANLEIFQSAQKRLLAALQEHPELQERIERLKSIRGVGEVTALTWALEVGSPDRFSSVRKAVSYCGLCSGQAESAGKTKRGPLSKQRNRHLQTVLIEAAKLAPIWNPQLAQVHATAIERGANRNRATLAVARKLLVYLLAVDKSGKPFEVRSVV